MSPMAHFYGELEKILKIFADNRNFIYVLNS